MKTISIFNIKGGVGKTITSVNLATCLAKMGKRALLLDLDAQSNATKYLSRYDKDLPSSYELLVEENIDTIDFIRETEIENLDIIPSNIRMILAENQIVNDTMRTREHRIRKALKELDNEYDYCIIDCPPTLGTVITNALVASNYVISPLKVDQFALDGFENLIDTINRVQREFNEGLNFMGVLITMDRSTRINKEVKKELREAIGDLLFNTSIRENVSVTQSTFENKPVVIYQPKSNASKDYFEFSKEVINYGNK